MAAPLLPASYQLHLALLKTFQRSISTTSCICRQQRLRFAGSEPLPTQKAANVTPVRVSLTSEEVDQLVAKKKKLIDPPLGDKFWEKSPVDDVWVSKYYPPKYYSLEECVTMHRQSCCAAMFDNEDGVVEMNLSMCMKTAKKTKFTFSYRGNVIPPHKFNTGKPKRKILALSNSPEELDVAKSYGVEMCGDPDLIAQIQRDEITLAEEGIDVVIATADVLQKLLVIRDKVPEFPAKKQMTTGYDMDTMVNLYTNGLPYQSTPIKGDPMVTNLSIPIGRLNMSIEQLEENWNHWKETLNTLKPLPGPVILEAKVECKPSFESFLLDMAQSHVESSELDDDECVDDDDDDDDDDESQELKAS